MKEIRINDDAYSRAESIAQTRNTSVSAVIEELVDATIQDQSPATVDIKGLYAALDKGRNAKSVGRLRRHELHDRAILHRY